ncbi:MAG: cation diffusion facilitator family transporter [Candidatus Cryptobacteroides sp.]
MTNIRTKTENGMDREKEIVRVTVWGAAANVALAVAKLFAGIVGKSAAMTADAIHSFSDLVSDVIVLAMVKVASRGKDKDHDYGHGKFETMATVAVALLLLVVGGKMLGDGVVRIVGFFRGEEMAVPGMIALWAALVSIAVKEALYQWTARVGRQCDSPAVVTNAWHHRSDAFSSIGSAVGIACAILIGGKWAIMDSVVACAISIFIIRIAVKMSVPALKELTEASLPEETEDEIERIIRSVEGVRDVHAMKTRKAGPGIIIESHIVVNPEMTVSQAHQITEYAEDKLVERFGPKTQISLHVEPSVESR